MNQQDLHRLNLIAGGLMLTIGVLQLYKTLSTNLPWNEVLGSIGFCLLGLAFLLQKKLNLASQIMLSVSAIICFVINVVVLFV